MRKESPLEREWKTFLKREEKTVRRYGKEKEPFWEKKLKTLVPETLGGKLDEIFLKAFRAVLKSGTGVIEKTYDREKLTAEYKTREYAADVYTTRKNLSAGKRKASAQTAKNVAGAGAEGAVLGLLGIGLPDIPLFIGIILRSLYTLALHFGIDYEDGEEQELLLDLLALSLYHGADFKERDAAMNRRLFAAAGRDRAKLRDREKLRDTAKLRDRAKLRDAAHENHACGEEAIRRAAKALSGELLYMKFLQGAPVVGVIGGIYDGIYLKTITDYASVKLERRYLLSKMEP